MRRDLVRCVALVIVLVSGAACGSSSSRRSAPTSTTIVPTTTTTTVRATTTTTTVRATTTTTTVRATTSTTGPPAFAGTASTVTAADLASSYHPGCPVGPAQLRRLRMAFWGFDGASHTGTMIVNAAVVDSVLAVFDTLYARHVPIRRMEPVDAFGASDRASMAADNTSSFNCRYVSGSDPPRWSAHAYGDAIDINTVENPYVQGSNVQPPAGAAFLDRSDHRPGMAFAGGDLVSAFAAVGWQWGGRWSDPDYQHFSSTGG